MHLNLKTAKKIDGDKDSSTFRTKEGHEFKVQHKALSAAMRKEVAAIPKFAEGGYVDTTTSGDPIVKAVKGKAPESPKRQGDDWSSSPTRSAKTVDKDDVSSEAQAFNAKMAQPLAEGGVAGDASSRFMSIEEQEQAAKEDKPLSVFYNPKKSAADTDDSQEETSDVQRFADGGEADTPEKIAADAQAQADAPPAQAPVTINIGQPQPAAAPPVSSNPNYTPEQMKQERGLPPGTSIGDLMAAGNMAPGPAISPAVASLPGPDGATPTVPNTDTPAPGSIGDSEGTAGPTPASVPVAQAPVQAADGKSPFETAYNMQLKGLQLAEKAQEMAAQGKEKALTDGAAAQQTALKSYDDNVRDAMSLRQEALKALQDGKIDPDRYWNNKSTGGKIGTILGILAAGFNPTHNPNAAIDMLNKEIDRDIDSQKADLGRKQNLLSAANDHFKNIQSAADFHRIAANDLISHQVDLAIAKAATPLAKSELMRLQGELQKNQAVLTATIGARQTLNGGSSNPNDINKALNTLDYTDKDAAKTYRARSVPGYGIAQRDIPDAVINEITAKKQLHDASTDLIDFIKNKGSSLSLNDRNIAAEKAQVVQSLYREGLLKTVYKQGEQPLLDKVVGENPLSFVNTILKTEPKKLQEIIGSNQRSLNTLLKTYGVPNNSQIPQRPPVLNKR